MTAPGSRQETTIMSALQFSGKDAPRINGYTSEAPTMPMEVSYDCRPSWALHTCHGVTFATAADGWPLEDTTRACHGLAQVIVSR
jgi:hypothetical protein